MVRTTTAVFGEIVDSFEIAATLEPPGMLRSSTRTAVSSYVAEYGLDGSDLSDDVEAVLCVQQHPQCPPHHSVIIGKHDRHWTIWSGVPHRLTLLPPDGTSGRPCAVRQRRAVGARYVLRRADGLFAVERELRDAAGRVLAARADALLVVLLLVVLLLAVRLLVLRADDFAGVTEERSLSRSLSKPLVVFWASRRSARKALVMSL
jgi:hypothetical protein